MKATQRRFGKRCNVKSLARPDGDDIADVDIVDLGQSSLTGHWFGQRAPNRRDLREAIGNGRKAIGGVPIEIDTEHGGNVL